MLYGPIIRRIRLSKGQQLQVVYHNICSKTNAIRFEKGEQSIAIEKFEAILERLTITMEEFKWITNNNLPKEDKKWQELCVETWNANQLPFFNNLLKLSPDTYLSETLVANYELLAIVTQEKPLSSEIQKIVANYFSRLENWNYEDLKFFANSCYILPVAQFMGLLNEVVPSLGRYRFYPGGQLVEAVLYSNVTARLILEEEIVLAKKYLTQLVIISKGSHLQGFRLFAKFYEGKLAYLYEDKEIGRRLLEKVLWTADYLDSTQLVEDVKKLLDSN
ncbi:hypothetical protein [Vagococcus intermedius]|uniref:HTH-type transcriptional regulator Rgg C-terminal domain-containing protein n=1 Tax=Vagococcus intermedius TaxID=2991418 RepID=A0AAF0CV87_9ENTE|nr:hypothetical protein [Vagococcus intermedius]WEG73489.1 hypothetical protein OL234_00855 [Vagococcus intermedius]WEG75573.1 hypothetical protein OL235_00865 [Vagococcus intermedius]